MSKYIYIAEYTGLKGLLRIGIVDFIPYQNITKLKFDEIDSEINILYQANYEEFFISLNYGYIGIDDVSISNFIELEKKLSSHKSSFLKDFYKISLNEALDIINNDGGLNSKIEFYKGKNIYSRQIAKFEKKSKDEESYKTLLFMDTYNCEVFSVSLENQWKSTINSIQKSNHEWYLKNEKRAGLLGKISGDSKKFHLEAQQRFLESINQIKALPQTYDIICSDAFINSQAKNKCKNKVSLKYHFYDFGGSWNKFEFGSGLESSGLSGKCNSCGKRFRYDLRITFYYFRPLYLDGFYESYYCNKSLRLY